MSSRYVSGVDAGQYVSGINVHVGWGPSGYRHDTVNMEVYRYSLVQDHANSEILKWWFLQTAMSFAPRLTGQALQSTSTSTNLFCFVFDIVASSLANVVSDKYSHCVKIRSQCRNEESLSYMKMLPSSNNGTAIILMYRR